MKAKLMIYSNVRQQIKSMKDVPLTLFSVIGNLLEIDYLRELTKSSHDVTHS